jgi:hypothetical protein
MCAAPFAECHFKARKNLKPAFKKPVETIATGFLKIIIIN